MTPFGRQLVIGLIVGPLVILGLFAWSAAGRQSPSGDSEPAVPAAAAAVAQETAGGNGSDTIGSEVTEGDTGTDRIRRLPQAQGLPEREPDASAPIGIRIADIGIDGDVVPVGVESDGAFEVPAVHQVGWYRFGSSAGQAGSTVLAAHISYDGIDGVFRHLESVTVGAAVDVDMADGSVERYEVVDVVEYHKSDLPVEDLFAESGSDRMVLITCGGTFNPRLRSYDSNVVAYAEAVD